jgi:thymidylate synthase (FAD)
MCSLLTREEVFHMSDSDNGRLIKVGGGAVELIDVMGDARTVVNAARVSMGKHVTEMGEADARLIRYLWEHEHTSPFRHVTFQFRLRAPIFVVRQWQKHQIGCSWNEISGRYVTFEDEAWSPERWRAQSAAVKQGSAGPLDDLSALGATSLYEEAISNAFETYQRLLALGVAKEQARAVLPLSLMTECFWTASLQAVLHFLKLRLDLHAQEEIRDFARAVRSLVEQVEGLEYVLSVALKD